MSEKEQMISLLDKVTEYDLKSIIIPVGKVASQQKNYVEHALDEADLEAENTTERLSHDEVFEMIRRKLNARV